MSATEAQRRQRGATVAEFALCVVVFLGVLFFILEAARALYLWNTLQEVTRRAAHAAAVNDFSNPGVMHQLRQSAIMRDGPGTLLLGAPVTDEHVQIDYLTVTRNADNTLSVTPIAGGGLPACPAQARVNCAANPYGGNCIRFVRARICAPNTQDCGAIAYQPIFPMTGISFPLPQAETLARAESLGFEPGSTLCP